MKLLDKIADWWLARCQHNGANVAADILDGDWDHGRVKYCRRCGAVQIAHDIAPVALSEWRRPRPLWHPERPE